MRFRTNMVRFLIPNIEGTPTNGDSKWHPTSDRFLDCFFIDLASVLGAILEPCWPAFLAQKGPGGFQDASKTVQDASTNVQDGPRLSETPPNLPQSPPDLDLGASKPGF